jgi:hypothetical protein
MKLNKKKEKKEKKKERKEQTATLYPHNIRLNQDCK